MAQGTKTENTAVNRLIEMAHERPLEADDALFSSPSPSSRKTLPPPFPGRIATVAPADPPPPLPRTRAPHSTQTHLNTVPPVAPPAVLDVPTRPFDQFDEEALADADEGIDAAVDDDDLPITVAEPAASKLDPPPLVVGHVEPLAARPSALGHIPGLEEAAWFDESVASTRMDEAVLGTEGVARGGGRAKTLLWLSAAFAAGLVATAIIVWPSGKSAVAPAPPPPVAAQAPAVAAIQVTPAPAAAPAVAAPAVVVAPAAEPAVVEPAVPTPTVIEPIAPEAAPAVVEPAVVAPAEPTAVRVVLESEPSGATVMLVDENGAQPLGQTPMVHEMELGHPYELMFTMAGHRSSLVTVDPAASKRVTVDLASSTAKVEAPAAAPVAPRAALVAPKAVARAAPRAEPKKAEPKVARIAKVEPVKAAPAKAAGGGGGTLMLGAKPPCDIFIDGKPTGLKTPQRAIKVSPGVHRVTLVSREHKITETFSVDIKAGAPTKIVKDLSRRMK